MIEKIVKIIMVSTLVISITLPLQAKEVEALIENNIIEVEQPLENSENEGTGDNIEKEQVDIEKVLVPSNDKQIETYDSDEKTTENAQVVRQAAGTIFVDGLYQYEIVSEEEQSVILLGFAENIVSDEVEVLETATTIDNTYKIIGIGNDAFQAKDIKNVDFSQATELLYIGEQAFSFNQINTLDLTNSTKLTKIERFSFYSNIIETINITNLLNLEVIGENAFTWNKLKLVNLSSNTGLTTIESSAFDNNLIEEVNLASLANLTTIGDFSFASNQIAALNLTNLPKLEAIGRYAFSGNQMKQLNISNLPNLSSIKESAFGQNALTEISLVSLPSLLTIGYGVFMSNKITVVELSNLQNLTLIDDAAFLGNKIAELKFSDLPELTTIGSMAFAINEFKYLDLRDFPKLTTIGTYAFALNDELRVVVLDKNNSLTTVGESVFEETKVQYFVSYDGENPFSDATNELVKGIEATVIIPESENNIVEDSLDLAVTQKIVYPIQVVIEKNASFDDWQVAWIDNMTITNDDLEIVDIYGDTSNIGEYDLEVLVTIKNNKLDDTEVIMFPIRVIVGQLATSIAVTPAEVTLNVGAIQPLTAEVLPATAEQTVTWMSSDESIATVNENGVVTAHAVGEVNITATTTDGSNLSATSHVIIQQLATSIAVTPAEVILNVGKTQALTAEVLPATAEQTVTWMSSDESIATVNENGVVTAHAVGEVNITATTTDGSNLSATSHVIIQQIATSIAVTPAEVTLNVGAIQLLTAQVLPATAKQPVSWTSSDESIATVNENGVVTTHAVGEVNITVTTTDGSNLSSESQITVQQLATSITVTPAEVTLNVGKTQPLTSEVLPATAEQQVTWMSSDESIATVNEDGVVTAHAVGEVNITAATTDGSNLSATSHVIIQQLATSIAVTPADVTLNIGAIQPLVAQVLPATAKQTVSWTSSDESIATVNENGVVTTHAVGEVNITATTTDGSNLSSTSQITVQKKEVGVPTPEQEKQSLLPKTGSYSNEWLLSGFIILLFSTYILKKRK